jgi:hypothetical protein
MLNDTVVQILPVLGAVRSGNIENKRLLQLGAVNLVNLWPSHQFVRRKRLDQLPAVKLLLLQHEHFLRVQRKLLEILFALDAVNEIRLLAVEWRQHDKHDDISQNLQSALDQTYTKLTSVHLDSSAMTDLVLYTSR